MPSTSTSMNTPRSSALKVRPNHSPGIQKEQATKKDDAASNKDADSFQSAAEVAKRTSAQRGSGEGEAIPFVMVGLAILMRTLLAQGASISGKALLRKAIQSGGEVVRKNGSHHIVKMPNGKQASIPVHGNKDLPIGTLRSIQKALGLN